MENHNKNKDGWLAKGGAMASLFAFIGASCCILPIILVNLGMSSALVSHLGWFARARPLLLTLSVMLILAGFLFAFRGGQKPTRLTLIILTLACLFTLGAFILPYYEGDLQRWLNLTNR